MVIDTLKEKLCINKLIATKRELLQVEGDMIVPDSKPDILNTICTSGTVCLYKKEILDDKVRLDGTINTYIMYLADDEKDKVRGLNTSIDFSETINVSGCKEGMSEMTETKLKSIECKIVNGRKIALKANLEVEIKIYSNDEVEIIEDIPNIDDIKILKEDFNVNSLVGMGETRVYAKDTLSIKPEDNAAEILKSNVCISDKDIKVSYNKILAKAEAQIKIMYLTEDNRIGMINTKIPIVGFIDMPNVTDENITDVNYEIQNIVMKLNSAEEHSVYVEIEVGIKASVYEEKQINLIQDLYSPSRILEFDKRKITTMTNKRNSKEMKQIREKIILEQNENDRLLDVDAIPIIEKESKQNGRISYEGNVEMTFIMESTSAGVTTRIEKIPFEYALENINNAERTNADLDIEIANQDFIIQDGGVVTSNIDLLMNASLYESANLNIINEIQDTGERENEDYSIIMYIVKKGDTLWKIAKKFGTTVEDIVRLNGIEDANKIMPAQKLFIPKYVKIGTSNRAPVMANG